MAKNNKPQQQATQKPEAVKEEPVTKVEGEGTSTEVGQPENTPEVVTNPESGSEEAAEEVNQYSIEEIAKRIDSDLPVVTVIAEHLARLATSVDRPSIQGKEELYINVPNIFYLINSVDATKEFPQLILALVDFFGTEVAKGDASPLAIRYMRQCFKGQQNKFTVAMDGLYRLGPKKKRQQLLASVDLSPLTEVYTEDRRQLFVPALEA